MNNYGTKILSDGLVSIRIPLCPYTKKNSQEIHRKTIGGKSVPFIAPSKAYKQYAADCSIFLKDLQIDYPVNVKAVFYMQTRRRVDLTNLNEALHDILVENGTLMDDNCRIIVSTDGSRVKYDKANPRTEVLITKADETPDF